MPWDDEYARGQAARAEELLSALESLPDSAAAARATDTVQTLVGLYGDCLARIMDHLSREEGGGGDAVRRLAGDELVGHLLLVHGLHPDTAETRVRRALAGLRSRRRLGEDEVGLTGISQTAAHIRLGATGRGCSSSPQALEQAVREAVAAAAPEIEQVEVDVETAPDRAPTALIPVDDLFRRPALATERDG
ncbi:NifU family protein [Streptomyces sp. HK10]|uniref:NifU family protein n=1 Tax=Streptomyces sp. HK10 TaxID=3373255 RepID=UPI0037494451